MMKKEYLVPEAKMIAFSAEAILGPSDSVILDQNGDSTPSAPGEEFGDITIF